jgi:hypothetical protein
MSDRLNGQWIGEYKGSSTGKIILNVDELATYYQGLAFLFEARREIPNTIVGFRTQSKETRFTVTKAGVLPINPNTGWWDTWDNIKTYYGPEATIAGQVEVTGLLDEDQLVLSWNADNGSYGNCKLPRSTARAPSVLAARSLSWEAFKEDVARLRGQRFLFRGQENPAWRLQTSFHRSGRADIYRFNAEDLRMLHRVLSARTRHVFNLRDADEYGAFLALVQHHGYPTPLLDWTYSPYVAAYFAYQRVEKIRAAVAEPNDKVRMFLFDQAQWKRDYPQVGTLLTAWPHLSVAEFPAIENERVVPQQGASLIATIDDIETYVREKETASGVSYLSAIDLPVRERDSVVSELSFMGIAAGSLFPGVDGTCAELRQRNFNT